MLVSTKHRKLKDVPLITTPYTTVNMTTYNDQTHNIWLSFWLDTFKYGKKQSDQRIHIQLNKTIESSLKVFSTIFFPLEMCSDF